MVNLVKEKIYDFVHLYISFCVPFQFSYKQNYIHGNSLKTSFRLKKERHGHLG